MGPVDNPLVLGSLVGLGERDGFAAVQVRARVSPVETGTASGAPIGQDDQQLDPRPMSGDRRHQVFVVELDDDVGPRGANPEFPWVDVGETSRTPEERFHQHLTRTRTKKGHRLFSTVVADHGLRLRPDPYAAEPLLYTHEDAKIAEALLGERLAQVGYSIKGAH